VILAPASASSADGYRSVSASAWEINRSAAYSVIRIADASSNRIDRSTISRTPAPRPTASRSVSHRISWIRRRRSAENTASIVAVSTTRSTASGIGGTKSSRSSNLHVSVAILRD
jgi:hypothetical protein